MAQIDLFTPLPAKPDFGIQDLEGWQERVLADMAEAPLVYCFPGFMGAVCESLVAIGRVTREPAGFMDPPDLPPRKLKAMGWRAEDHAQFRYALAGAA